MMAAPDWQTGTVSPVAEGPPYRRGRLHVFLGLAPGAGKTYAMLTEGRRLADEGRAVVVGLAETHGRAATESMLGQLTRVRTRQVAYRGSTFEELDVDAVLACAPSVVLVDELAHSCVPGSRHAKRWEDVDEILASGVDVVTTLNVQHIDSLNDSVERITGVPQRETVPDAVIAAADRVELVDVTPEQLRTRIERKELMAESSQTALAGFYSAEHLSRLRQAGVGWLAGHGMLQVGSAPRPVPEPGQLSEGVVVALTGAPEAEHVLRRAAHIASTNEAPLVGVYVRVPSDTVESAPPWLAGQQRLLSELGGRYVELAGIDVASVVLEFARNEGARQLVLGATRRSRLEELLHGSVINKAIRTAGPIEVHIVPPLEEVAPGHPSPAAVTGRERVVLPAPRRTAAWALAIALPGVITVALVPVRPSLQLAGVLLCNLLAVVGVALLGGFRPGMLATAVAFVASDFFYAPPFYSLRVGRWVDLIALITFVVVAGAVGALVDLLTRQGLRVARTSAEGENLARLAAGAMVAPHRSVEAIAALRQAFGLDGVALLHREENRWRVDAAVGHVTGERPEDFGQSVEVAPGQVLVLSGSSVKETDAALLGSFLDQIRFARESEALEDFGAD